MTIEYLLVVGFIGLTTAVAIVSVFPAMRARYAAEAHTLSQPYP